MGAPLVRFRAMGPWITNPSCLSGKGTPGFHSPPNSETKGAIVAAGASADSAPAAPQGGCPEPAHTRMAPGKATSLFPRGVPAGCRRAGSQGRCSALSPGKVYQVQVCPYHTRDPRTHICCATVGSPQGNSQGRASGNRDTFHPILVLPRSRSLVMLQPESRELDSDSDNGQQ